MGWGFSGRQNVDDTKRKQRKESKGKGKESKIRLDRYMIYYQFHPSTKSHGDGDSEDEKNALKMARPALKICKQIAAPETSLNRLVHQETKGADELVEMITFLAYSSAHTILQPPQPPTNYYCCSKPSG